MGRSDDAARVAARALTAGVVRESLAQAVALAALEDKRDDEALEALSPFLEATTDADTLWLAIRARAVPALMATVSLSLEEHDRLTRLVDRYRALGGVHLDRATEWLQFLTASSSAP
jgi:hypothetical protein